VSADRAHRWWHRVRNDDPWITYGDFSDVPDAPLFHFVCTRRRCAHRFASIWPYHGIGEGRITFRRSRSVQTPITPITSSSTSGDTGGGR